MTIDKTAPGSAHPLPQGRLTDFETAGGDDMSLTDLLPARTRRTRPETLPPTTPPQHASPSPHPSGDEAPSGLRTDTPPTDAPDSSQPTPPATVSPVAPDHAPRPGRSLGIRQTVLNIPIDLRDLLVAERDCTGTSNAVMVIRALEEAYPHLPGLLTPSTPTQGSLFAPRPGRALRVGAGEPLTQFNIRLRPADFDVLDGLVHDLGASSRSELVTVALRWRYTQQP